MMAPPGYPNNVLTSSATRQRNNVSEPEIILAGDASFLELASPAVLVFVSNASISCCFYLFRILQQNSTFHSQLRLYPGCFTFGQGCSIHHQVYGAAPDIY